MYLLDIVRARQIHTRTHTHRGGESNTWGSQLSDFACFVVVVAVVENILWILSFLCKKCILVSFFSRIIHHIPLWPDIRVQHLQIRTNTDYSPPYPHSVTVSLTLKLP